MRIDPSLLRQASNPTSITKTNNVDGKDNRPHITQTEKHEPEEIGPVIVELRESKNIPINEMNPKID